MFFMQQLRMATHGMLISSLCSPTHFFSSCALIADAFSSFLNLVYFNRWLRLFCAFRFFFFGHQACFSFRTFLLEFILLSKAWYDSYKFHRLNNRQLDHPEGGFASSIINLLMSVEQNLWGSHHLEQFEPPLNVPNHIRHSFQLLNSWV